MGKFRARSSNATQPPNNIYSLFRPRRYFPLSNQNNALRQITRQINQNCYLHPGCEISLVLHRRLPDGVYFDRLDIGDENYFERAGALAQDMTTVPHDTLKVSLKGVSLVYESLILENREHASAMMRATSKCYADFPLLRLNLLQSGVQFDSQRFTLPEGVKLVYLVCLSQHQIKTDSRPHNFVACRYRFPRNLQRLKMSLTDNDGLLFKDGLEDLSSENGQTSQSLTLYHGDLLQKGLYSRTLPCLIPPDVAAADYDPQGLGNLNVGYDQAILLDLTPYKTDKKPTELVVDLWYFDQAVERQYFAAFCVQQREYTYSDRSRWSHQLA